MWQGRRQHRRREGDDIIKGGRGADVIDGTGGNPLFLVNLVDYLEHNTQAETPAGLQAG